MASAAPRWWRAALARRVLPLIMAPNPSVGRMSRFPSGYRNVTSSSGVNGDGSDESNNTLPVPSADCVMMSQGNKRLTQVTRTIEMGNKHTAITQGMKKIRDTTLDVDEHEQRTYENAYMKAMPEVIDGKSNTWGEPVDINGWEEALRRAIMLEEKWDTLKPPIYPYHMNILSGSSHRDGSIYGDTDIGWKEEYHIADRNETPLESMMLSDPADCVFDNGYCLLHSHSPGFMLQIFSLMLAEISVHDALVDLYGYIAVRDKLDPSLNYIVNFSRDDPITVKKGSLLTMAGPKRGVALFEPVLIEYDMRIKTGEQEKDDLQLIDGASSIGAIGSWNNGTFTNRIHGNCGAIDITIERF